MPRGIRVIKIDPVKKTYVPMILEGGASFVRPIQRAIRAKQLGWKELCKIEDQRLMGVRAKADGPGTETFDAGPTPLIVAADAEAEKGTPGFRLRGGKPTAGVSILFGQGIGGGMADCPVNTAWLDRLLVWLTPEEAEEDDATCKNHPDRRVRETLDGDALCQECCDAWVRAEGQHAADVASEAGEAQ